MSRRTAGPRSRPAAGSPGRGGLASPVAQASGRSAGRPGAAAVPTIPPRIRTAAGPGSGERSGRGWPLPAGHSPNKGALRPLRAPVPAPPRTVRPDPPDANPIRDNPSSHPAGTCNPLRPRPAPFCCLENNNSAGSAVRLSPLSWEKNLLFGSSPKSGEGRPDLQEEVGVVPVAVGYPLDDLDLVVDAFDQIGSQRPAAVGQDPRQVGLEPPHEHAQRLQAAAQGSSLPALPRFPGPCLAPVAP